MQLQINENLKMDSEKHAKECYDGTDIHPTLASTVQNTADALTEGFDVSNLVGENVHKTAAVPTSLHSTMGILPVKSNGALSALFGAAVPATGHAITMTTNTTTTTTSSTIFAGGSQNSDPDSWNFSSKLSHENSTLFAPFESNRTVAKSQLNENENKHNNDTLHRMDVTENIQKGEGYIEPIRIRKTNVVSNGNMGRKTAVYNISKNSRMAKRIKRSNTSEIVGSLSDSRLRTRHQSSIEQTVKKAAHTIPSDTAENKKSMPRKQNNKNNKNALNSLNTRDLTVTKNRFQVLSEEVDKAGSKRKNRHQNGASEEEESDVSDMEWPNVVHAHAHGGRRSFGKSNENELRHNACKPNGAVNSK